MVVISPDPQAPDLDPCAVSRTPHGELLCPALASEMNATAAGARPGARVSLYLIGDVDDVLGEGLGGLGE
jgi:hypothetical protein